MITPYEIHQREVLEQKIQDSGKHPTTREHYEKFKAYVDAAPKTVEAIAMGILKELVSDRFFENIPDPVEYLRSLYKADRLLNNTFMFRKYLNRMEIYDRHSQQVARAVMSGLCVGKMNWSLSDNVCALKHCMIHRILGLEPVFVEEYHEEDSCQ